MRNSLLIILLAFLSCKKEKPTAVTTAGKSEIQSTALVIIKDTVIFGNSAEGENLELFTDSKTGDSVLKSTAYGESGKAEYQFIFNKTLKEGKAVTFQYAEPTTVNAEPELKKKSEENLSSSKQSNEKLNQLFLDYIKVFRKKNEASASQTNKNWTGDYALSLNDDSEDWRDIHSITIHISKDSVTYLAEGFQLYQYFKLKANVDGKSLSLNYEKSLDNTGSFAPGKTKDFGKITLENGKYLWESPYIDENFGEGTRQKYELQKK